MKLPSPTVRKLFRECFPNETSICIDPSKLRSEASRWRKAIAKIEGVHITKHPGDRDSRAKTLCRFTIPNPDEPKDQYYRSDELRLEYDDDAKLKLVAYNYRFPEHSAFVSSLDEIETLVREVRKRYAKRTANQKKREKVKQFKSKAILAQVARLAQEESFEYATQHDSVKLKLYIRLTDYEMMQIDVPFKQFEVLLPKLRATIIALRELYAQKMRFRIRPVSSLPWDAKWQQPKAADQQQSDDVSS